VFRFLGVTTIAGGKSGRGGHVDGPSDEAKFSTDFEVRYIGSSCSLLVIDRGNQAIREIQLHFDDCVYQYEAGFPLGILYIAPFSAIIAGPEKPMIKAYHLNVPFKLYDVSDHIKFLCLQESHCFLLPLSLATCLHCFNAEF